MLRNRRDGKKEQVPTPEKYLAKLVHWDDLPEWQKDNHYIHAGYVRETNSMQRCAQSLAYLHNETVNIYSHLLPSLVFAMLPLLSIEIAVPRYNTTTWRDELAMAVFSLGSMACLGLSSIFHTLKSHSDRVAGFGNKLDYLGIVILIDASMVSMIYFGVYNHYTAQCWLWGITTLLGIGCAVVSLDDTFRTPEWRTFRASMFVAYGLSGVLPIAVAIYLFGYEEAVERSQIWYLVLEGVLYIGGAVLYAARLPERVWPGKFDIWGHSHQIFHVLVVLAAMSHGKGLIEAYKHVHNNVL